MKRQIALSEISSKINVKTQQERVVTSRKVEAKRDEQQRKRAGEIAVTELEKQFANVRRTKKLSPLPEKDGVSSELVKHAASRGKKLSLAHYPLIFSHIQTKQLMLMRTSLSKCQILLLERTSNGEGKNHNMKYIMTTSINVVHACRRQPTKIWGRFL